MIRIVDNPGHEDHGKHYIALEDIKITRERARTDNGNVEELAASILKHGQFYPIILDDEHELVAGFRRLSAFQLNFAQDIWFVYRRNIDEELAREMELEENLRRKQMTPIEELRGLADLDRIRRAKNPNWTQLQTAAVASTSQRKISQATQVMAMVKMFPEIAEAKSIRQAISWCEQKASSIIRVQDVKANPTDYQAIEDKIALGDSVQYIKTLANESVHHIVTDPPFGIDAHERKEGTSGTLTSYQDDDNTYRRFLSMAGDCYRILRPNGFLVWFYGMSWHTEVQDAFTQAGFTVDYAPFIWDRSEGRTHTNRPDHYFTRGYDVALFAFKGNPQLIRRGRPNIVRIKPVENSERVTLFERPVELYNHIIQTISVPGETIADFFIGSGSCPAAAAELGRDYIGCELDPERRAYAIQKIKNHTSTKK